VGPTPVKKARLKQIGLDADPILQRGQQFVSTQGLTMLRARGREGTVTTALGPGGRLALL
jgi:hypothetical protein